MVTARAVTDRFGNLISGDLEVFFDKSQANQDQDRNEDLDRTLAEYDQDLELCQEQI